MYMCDMTHSRVWHDWWIFVPWLIHPCAMTQSHVWHDSFIHVPWLIHIQVPCLPPHSITSHIHTRYITDAYVCHDSIICVTHHHRSPVVMPLSCLHDRMRQYFHIFACHAAVRFVTWLVRVSDMTRLNVRHDSFTFVTWLIHMCDMMHSYLRHDSFTCAMTHSRLISRLILMCYMIRLHVWHDPLTSFFLSLSLSLARSLSLSLSSPHPFTATSGDAAASVVEAPGEGSFDSKYWNARINTPVTWLIHMREMTYSHVRHVRHVIHIGWRRYIGCLKL